MTKDYIIKALAFDGQIRAYSALNDGCNVKR